VERYNFYFKMHQKPLGARALPGPAGVLTGLKGYRAPVKGKGNGKVAESERGGREKREREGELCLTRNRSLAESLVQWQTNHFAGFRLHFFHRPPSSHFSFTSFTSGLENHRHSFSSKITAVYTINLRQSETL